MEGPLALVASILALRFGQMTDEELSADIPQVIEANRQTCGKDVDRGLQIVDLLAGQILHRELILRGRDVEALDLFSTLNGLHDGVLPPGMTYTEYVESLRPVAN